LGTSVPKFSTKFASFTSSRSRDLLGSPQGQVLAAQLFRDARKVGAKSAVFADMVAHADLAPRLHILD
jgi:hypothetical protein